MFVFFRRSTVIGYYISVASRKKLYTISELKYTRYLIPIPLQVLVFPITMKILNIYNNKITNVECLLFFRSLYLCAVNVSFLCPCFLKVVDQKCNNIFLNIKKYPARKLFFEKLVVYFRSQKYTHHYIPCFFKCFPYNYNFQLRISG